MGATGSALGLLEWAMNRVLAADAEVRDRLVEVERARIRIVVEPWLRPIDVEVRGTRVAVISPEASQGEDENDPDVTISGSVPALAAFLLRPGTRQALPRGISVRGDLELARRLGRLARCYRFDWEESLSRCLGDVGAHEAARRARAAGRWSRNAAGILSRDVAEYLSEESDMVAGEAVLGRFCDAVDEVRDDVERLEARIAALLRRVEEGRP